MIHLEKYEVLEKNNMKKIKETESIGMKKIYLEKEKEDAN